MPTVKNMVGSPWHVEKMTRQEGDARRHKSNCKYYCKNKNYCAYRFEQCPGSAHCDYYVEKKKTQKRIS